VIPLSDSAPVVTGRWIVPMQCDPIPGGWVRIQADRIVEMGSRSPPAEAIDLGDVAILPGLINAHTHLEFSSFDRPIGQRGIELADWIADVIDARAGVTADDRQSAIRQGMIESDRCGVRLVGEITTPPVDYPNIDSPQELIHFCEVIGLSVDRSSERFAAAMTHAKNQRDSDRRSNVSSIAISPHAPYSTLPETVDRCVRWSAQYDRPLAMHVAESPAERELLVSGSGPIAESLRRLGLFDPSLFPRSNSPFNDLIQQLSGCSRGLLIHCNDLRQSEIEQLARHRNLSAVFCPRTHHHFGFPRHCVGELISAGVRVALGTDSRASNPDLNLWGEVQFLLKHRPDLDPLQVLAMATIHGADALGRKDLGRIAIGCCPNLITVRSASSSVDGLYRDLAESPPPAWVPSGGV
jgi:cytosine/adenosine deaminase-related metal-dependent hydrolase